MNVSTKIIRRKLHEIQRLTKLDQIPFIYKIIYKINYEEIFGFYEKNI